MRMSKTGPSLVLVLALAGCSGSDGDDGQEGATSSSSVDVASTVASAGPGATVAPLPVLGSGTTSDQQVPIRVDLNEVRAVDQVVTVTFTGTNTLPDTEDTHWQVSDFFSAGLPDDVSGVYLLDAKNALRYLPATTGEKTCVCSDELNGVFVDPGRSMVFQVTFKAPPADVAEVQVAIPRIPPITAKITR